jgi:microcystin-dependent protein
MTSAITSDTAELTTQQNINTAKLTNINYNGVITNITNLSIDGQPSVSVSAIEKNKIYANEGNIYTNIIDISKNTRDIQYNTNFRENSVFFDYRITTNTNNIQINTSKILTLENSIDDHGGQDIIHSSNIGINGTNINTLSKSLHNDSIHIYNCTVKCNDLLNQTSTVKTDVLNNTNEIQQTKLDLITTNNEINDNKIKSLENEQQININTANISNMVPVGTILITAIPPTISPSVGYLYCDGASVSISTYGNLYAILGNTYKYNKQEYSGYFYLPDMRQLFVRGSQQNETYPVNAQPVSIGTYQGQSIQTHSHNFEKSGQESAGSGGLGTITVGSNSYTATKTSNMFDHVNNQIYPATAETRPESISMNYMIKY